MLTRVKRALLTFRIEQLLTPTLPLTLFLFWRDILLCLQHSPWLLNESTCYEGETESKSGGEGSRGTARVQPCEKSVFCSVTGGSVCTEASVLLSSHTENMQRGKERGVRALPEEHDVAAKMASRLW